MRRIAKGDPSPQATHHQGRPITTSDSSTRVTDLRVDGPAEALQRCLPGPWFAKISKYTVVDVDCSDVGAVSGNLNARRR
jgi:hypothetical protein